MFVYLMKKTVTNQRNSLLVSIVHLQKFMKNTEILKYMSVIREAAAWVPCECMDQTSSTVYTATDMWKHGSFETP